MYLELLNIKTCFIFLFVWIYFIKYYVFFNLICLFSILIPDLVSTKVNFIFIKKSEHFFNNDKNNLIFRRFAHFRTNQIKINLINEKKKVNFFYS